MSRTYKDKPSKLRFPSSDNWVYTEGYHKRELPTIEPKKRKELDTEWHWLHGTPSWWNNLFHTRPIRGNFRKFTKALLKSGVEDIVDCYEPSDSKSPHKYYW